MLNAVFRKKQRDAQTTLAAQNMKKIIPVLALVIGVGVGWGIARYQSHQYFQRLLQTWTPEFQQFVSESCALGKEMEATMTKDGLREYMNLVVETGNKVITDSNSQAYGRAFQALLTKKLLKDGRTDEALSNSESCLKNFVEKYDRGDFKGDINEEIVKKLVAIIKSSNKANEPTSDNASDSVDTQSEAALF